MTAVDLIETLSSACYKAYKKHYRGKELDDCLSAHKEIEVEGVVFTYWRELVIYKVAKLIQKITPNATVHVELAGNESQIQLEATDEEIQKLTAWLYNYEKEKGIIEV